jgi:U4/U6.U5 tri-snRNP-associated protein 1
LYFNDITFQQNVERKKNKPGYNAYDDEKLDEFGNVTKSLLGKYDEEIDGEKTKKFVIGKILVIKFLRCFTT